MRIMEKKSFKFDEIGEKYIKESLLKFYEQFNPNNNLCVKLVIVEKFIT